MASILRPFAVIAQAVKAFFRAHVRVRRGDRGLELVLDEAAPRPARAGRRGEARADAATLKEQQELQRMQASLTRLLDDRPANRSALRQLAFIEQALAKKGLRGLAKLPYDVLGRALDQFEGLVTNWSDEGLAALRSRMAVLLIEREAEAQTPGASAAGQDLRDAEGIDSGSLAHAVTLAGEEAAQAEAALRAAYGDVMLNGLDAGGASATRRGDGPPSPARGHELPA